MTDFVKGDTVKLKSGGPTMTITDIGEYAIGGLLVSTAWFDDKKQLDGQFPPESLRKVTPSTGVKSFSFTMYK